MEQSKGRIINEWDILDENLHRQEAAMPFSQFVARHVAPSLLQFSSPVGFLSVMLPSSVVRKAQTAADTHASVLLPGMSPVQGSPSCCRHSRSVPEVTCPIQGPAARSALQQRANCGAHPCARRR